jgi:hypothetical protein
MKYGTFALCFLVLISGCSDPSEVPVTKTGIEVSDARIRLPLNGVTTSAAYVSLTNHDDVAVEIVSASSNIAKTLELHEHKTNGNGMMEMRQVDSFAIAPHETLVLAPMGKHIMLFEVQGRAKAGDIGHITLNTKSGAKVEIDANFVENPNLAAAPNNHDKKSSSGHENHSDN